MKCAPLLLLSILSGSNLRAGELTTPPPEAPQGGDKSQEVEEIVVTGTHLRGDANPTAPLQVISRADIERSGYTTTQQLAFSIPQNFGGGSAGASEDGLLGSGSLAYANDAFATGLNLRGLGPSSTLVLVNGHRLAPSAVGITPDISSIPLSAIDRVEIMSSGASAIYGADAVAGVVNFILRKNYDGQESRASYGAGTDGDRPERMIAQSVGRSWTTGNALATVQYQGNGALDARDREYTAGATQPTDLLPRTRQYSALFNVRQSLPADFALAADTLYSSADRSGSFSIPGAATSNTSDTDNGVASITLTYQPGERWRTELSGTYSRQHTVLQSLVVPASFGGACGAGPCHTHDDFTVWSGDLTVDGALFRLPAGEVKAAFGGSYRTEGLDWRMLELPPPVTFDRHVSAEYLEVEVPVLGREDLTSRSQQVVISLAARRDDYSDFGATTNPRYGIAWVPVEGLRLRGAYGTSFRAPNAYEQAYARVGTTELVELPLATSSGAYVPAFYLGGGGSPELRPERSHNLNAGVEFSPPHLADLKMSVDYFDIRYHDRIITPVFDAAALSMLDVYGSLITPVASDTAAQSYINAVQSRGGAFYDLLGTNGVGVRYLENGFEQNAAFVRTNGIDLAISDLVHLNRSALRAGLNLTYIAHIDTSYTANSTPTDIVNTYANPLHWRGRAELGWSRGPLAMNAAANYSGSYVDTTMTPHGPIDSWSTIDMQISYEVPLPCRPLISLSGTNILNRNPPYVAGQNQLGGAIHYDVGNGNPLGRRLVLSARAAW